ncbi:UDP-glycosyltransferase [Flavobacteriaceae bacterium]|nr:UDP-glycosyltransferase [Flavobacteriaceae bacterium]
MSKKKIVILVPDGVGIRNFAYGEFRKIILEHDFELIFWNTTSYSLSSSLGLNEVFIDYGKSHPFLSIYTRARKEIQLNLSIIRNQDEVYNLYRFPFSYSSLKNIFRSLYCKYLIFRYNSETGLKKIIKKINKLEQSTNRYKHLKNQLISIQPSFILSTNQRTTQIIAPILAARNLKIPTAAFIFSWDNVPKAMQVVDCDYYFVWSELMKRQQLKYYPNNSPSQVFVTGTPQFEFHFDKSLRMEREVFFEKYGLDQSKRYLCFSGDDITTSPLDQFYLEDLAVSVEQLNHLGYNLGIIYRKCPVDNTNRYDKILAKYRDVIKVIDPDWTTIGGQWNQIVPNQGDKALLYNICEHSELVANVCSTTVFDFVLHNKPCIYFNYEQPQLKKGIRDIGQNYKYVHFRSMPSQRAVIFCHNKNELISLLEETLTNKLSNVSECEKWFEIVAGNQPQGASRNIWKSINSILN